MAVSDWRVWDAEQCRVVHDATLKILSEVGVEFQSDQALKLLEGAGAKVSGSRVRMDRQLVDECIAGAPRTWPMRWRDSGNTLELADGNVYYGTGSDCLYVDDPKTGARRRAKVADVEGMAALCETLPEIDFVMSMGLPEDVPRSIDDVAQMAAMLRGTRKPIVIAPREGSVLDAMHEMAAVCGDASSWAVYAMPSPPLQHDPDAISKIIGCAKLKVPLVYAPAPCAGTTAPASTAATVLVGNAEVLSGLVLHQIVQSGAPFVYGAGVDIMDMRDVVPSYALPEVFLGNHAACDLARDYGLPSFAYAGDSDSKLFDEQWAAEAAFTAILGAISRATLLHDVGYLETGLRSSFEAILLGDELVGFAREFAKDLTVDDESLAVDEIAEIGPGGEHLGRKYTRRRYRSFWLPKLFDHSMYDRWIARGGQRLSEKVHQKVEEFLAGPRPYALEEDAVRRLDELVHRVEETRV